MKDVKISDASGGKKAKEYLKATDRENNIKVEIICTIESNKI